MLKLVLLVAAMVISVWLEVVKWDPAIVILHVSKLTIAVLIS